MKDIRWQQRFENFNRALHQLTLAVEFSGKTELSDLEKQGVIQGFKFVHELAWNVLKDFLQYEGIQGLVGSRSTVREAFKRELITEGEMWMDMIEKRNLSSHTYDLELASNLVRTIIDQYYPAFLALQKELQQRSM